MSGHEREHITDRLNLVWQVPLAVIFGVSDASDDERTVAPRKSFDLGRMLHNARVRLMVSHEDQQEAEEALDLALTTTGGPHLSEAERKKLEHKTLW